MGTKGSNPLPSANFSDEISALGSDKIDLADFIDGYRSPGDKLRRIYGTGFDLPV